MRYISLGDSIALGVGSTNYFGYVYYFRDFLEKMYGPVHVTNRAIPGMTTASILKQLLYDRETQSALKVADIITISIGGGNIIICAGDNYTTINPDCALNGIKAFGKEWKRILSILDII